MAIQSFADRHTEKFFKTGTVSKVPWVNVRDVARRKLDMISYAAKLTDLKAPPGNRLEALSGRLAGKHSIRINDQWRIVFMWTDAGPADVEIVDYH
jgi:proteic killer suppression protein